MCSCVIALANNSQSIQYTRNTLMNTRRYVHDEDIPSSNYEASPRSVLPKSASSPPSLGEHYVSAHCGSLCTPLAPQHHDGSVYVFLKKHESQFKLSQGRIVQSLRLMK